MEKNLFDIAHSVAGFEQLLGVKKGALKENVFKLGEDFVEGGMKEILAGNAFTMTITMMLPDSLVKSRDDPAKHMGTESEVTSDLCHFGWEKGDEGNWFRSVEHKLERAFGFGGKDSNKWKKDSESSIEYHFSPATVGIKNPEKFTLLLDAFKKKFHGMGHTQLLMHLLNMLPFKDNLNLPKVGTDEEKKNFQKFMHSLKLGQGEGQAMPDFVQSPTFDFATPEGIGNFFFYGAGVVLLKELPAGHEDIKKYGPYVVDFKSMKDLEVRMGFVKYGVRMHFDLKKTLVAVHNYNVKKTFTKESKKEDWEHALFLAKSCATVEITVKNHLMWTHMLSANNLVNSAVECLPPSHPIRRLLTVFTYRTSYVNQGANVLLFSKNGLMQRATAFTWDSFGKALEQCVEESDIFRPFPEMKLGPNMQKLVDEDDFPFYTDGKAFHDCISGFVEKWMEAAVRSGHDFKDDVSCIKFYTSFVEWADKGKYKLPAYSPKALKDLISQLIFVVTGYHELVGQAIDYAGKPSWGGGRVVEGATVTDIQCYLLLSVVIASTSLPTPRLHSNFENYFSNSTKHVKAPAYEEPCWEAFQENLVRLSDTMKKNNSDDSIKAALAGKKKGRKHKFVYFDPLTLECSVSV